MAEVEENVRETEVAQNGNKQVVREKTSTASSEETIVTAANAIWFIVGVIEVLLGLRFIMKLLGANPNSGFVDFIYTVSGIFVAPFNGIFSTATAEGDVVSSVFDPATLVAMLIYVLLGWGLVKLLTLNKRDAEV